MNGNQPESQPFLRKVPELTPEITDPYPSYQSYQNYLKKLYIVNSINSVPKIKFSAWNNLAFAPSILPRPVFTNLLKLYMMNFTRRKLSVWLPWT